MHARVEMQTLGPVETASPWEEAWAKLTQLVAMLTAIEFGELLSDLPGSPDARARHAAGVSVLAAMERELLVLAAEFKARALAEDGVAFEHGA